MTIFYPLIELPQVKNLALREKYVIFVNNSLVISVSLHYPNVGLRLPLPHDFMKVGSTSNLKLKYMICLGISLNYHRIILGHSGIDMEKISCEMSLY